MKILNTKHLYRILEQDSPKDVLDEVHLILRHISSDFDVSDITESFIFVINLYQGRHTGYLACNTNYHNLFHTTGTFLAMARIIHGSILDGELFTDREIVIALKAALFHDAGYIQEESDRDGTGAKYTQDHVSRSMEFFQGHAKDLNLSEEAGKDGASMILCTDIAVDVDLLTFRTERIGVLGRMLAVADLIAQMSDRTYVEKLKYLYEEFEEGKVGNYKNEADLVRKTIDFYAFAYDRIFRFVKKIDRFLKLHFISRWKINENLYFTAIENQRSFLKKNMLNKSDEEISACLNPEESNENKRKRMSN